MRRPLLAPDVLVLAAGGVVGEAWMTGVLAGIEDAAGIDLRRTEQLVGTSAGAIVAARLAAGRSPRRPGRDAGAGEALARAAAADGAPVRRLGAAAVRAAAHGLRAATAPLAAPALAAGAPGRAATRAMALWGLPRGARSLDGLRRSVDALGARFDGRLRVVAVDRATGRRVAFGRPGAPPAGVGEAVAASCAIPWVFEPVAIGGREYVDGGLWSVTNLDVAAAGRDTEVLCLSVMAGLPAALSSPLGLLRAASQAAEVVEAQALRARGARVRVVGPDPAAARALGLDLMDGRRASDALAAGFAQGRALATAPA